MDNNRLFDGIVVFCATVEAGSFTAAAANLGHTVSYMSKEVARLETRLGTRLLNRTTRKISLTEPGRLFYENGRRMIEDAEGTISQIFSKSERPSGHLKISAPVMFSDARLNAWLPEFARRYSDVSLDIEVTERFVDIVAEGFDVVVRAGELEESDFISRTLMSTRRMTVASPDYLKMHGLPLKPDDLNGHALISFAFHGIENTWIYNNPEGGSLTVPIVPKIRCNSASMEVELAASGFGITRIPQLAGEKELAEGRLVPILQDFDNPDLKIHAVYPSRRHLAPKVRAFVDFLVEKCASEKTES